MTTISREHFHQATKNSYHNSKRIILWDEVAHHIWERSTDRRYKLFILAAQSNASSWSAIIKYKGCKMYVTGGMNKETTLEKA